MIKKFELTDEEKEEFHTKVRSNLFYSVLRNGTV